MPLLIQIKSPTLGGASTPIGHDSSIEIFDVVRNRVANPSLALILAAEEMHTALKLCAENIAGCLEQDDLPSMVILETARKALAKAKGAA